MTDLENLLEAAASDGEPGDADAMYAQASARARTIRNRRRMLATGGGVIAIIVVAASVAFAMTGDNPAKVQVSTPPSSATTSSTVPYSGPPRHEVVAVPEVDDDGRVTICVGTRTLSVPSGCSAEFTVKGGQFPSTAQREAQFFRMVGVLNGKVLTLTEPATPAQSPAVLPTPPTTPCPEPAGGWRVRDTDRATTDDFNALYAAAEAEPDFVSFRAGGKVAPGSPVIEGRNQVIVVAFTGDLDRHRTELEKIWGGALCVTSGPHSHAQLNTAVGAAAAFARKKGLDVQGFGFSAEDFATLQVLVAPPGFQEAIDRNVHGAGLVKLETTFKPLDE